MTQSQLDFNIFLIGFMGTGKSAISKVLGERLGLTVLDCDAEIEAQEDMAIKDIFGVHGEEYFRNLETRYLLSLQGRKGVIVSCGGGTPLRKENVEAMRNSGKIILLTASPETIFERVKNSHDRPLLENNKTVEHIAGLLAGREEKYLSAADYVIATDNKSKNEIVDEIIRAIG